MAKNTAKKVIDDKVIKVTSAVDLDDSIMDSIKEQFGKNYELKVKKDPSIIGGIEIRKANELFDGTITHQLEILRDKLYNLKSYDKYN